MAQKINLKEIERKAWRYFYQDGLWDIFWGLLLLAMAISALLADIGTSEPLQYGVLIALEVLAILVLLVGKRLITVPRMGRAKFGPKRRRRLSKVSVILAISVLVGMVFFLAGQAVTGNLSKGMILEFILPAGWVVNCLLVFSLMAYFLDFSRLYLIGVLYAVAVPLDVVQRELSSIDLTFVAFGVPAAVILLMGAVVFVRFLRKYPLSAEASLDGNS
jgi:hypothetical protein